MRKIKLILLSACLAFGSAFAAPPTINLMADPAAGVAPYSTVLTWSVTPSGVTCNASGGWTGSKALSGSQTLTVSANTTYTLDCTTNQGPVTLNWNPPTQNEDGSALTDLAAYLLYRAPTCAELGTTSTPTEIAAPASSYTYNVPVGPRCFGMKARNSAGVESDWSNTVSKTVVGETASKSVSVVVSTQPNPPVIVTVSTLVMELRYGPNGTWLAKELGTVPLGTECLGGALKVVSGADWYEIPETSVTPKSNINLDSLKSTSKIVARCA